MALRCFLVGLVACFGFDAPAASDVAGWSESGRAWLSALTSELASLRVGATRWLVALEPTSRPDAGPLPPPGPASGAASVAIPGVESTIGIDPDPADESFGAITAATVAGFVADEHALAVIDAPPAPEADGDVLTPRDAAAEASRLVQDQREQGGTEPIPTDVAEAGDPYRPARAERLTSAVRLTHEAVQAWAALARAVGTEGHPLR